MQNKKLAGGRAKTTVIIVLFLIAALLSVYTAGKISINYNLADYLGDDTQTKIALDIIEDEFGSTGTIQVMVKNVSKDEAESICDTLGEIDNVLNVNFDKNDETYYKDGNALFIVLTDGDDYSDNAIKVSEDIKLKLNDYSGVEYGGTTIEKQKLRDSITSEMVYILAISLCLVVAILLITSESFIEPVVLLLASGVAVLINRGTNVIFGEISYITNSISAILQLALSVDYSIVLLHSYRREKQTAENNYAAMNAAVKSVVKPVSASALTTIAGLLALLFMSFKIGFDIGIVLMKGIVISAITSVTLLPAFVLISDKLLQKTHKKAFVPKGKGFCKTAIKAGKAIVPIALCVVIAAGVLQTGNTFTFSDTDSGNANITSVFGSNNSVVIVYQNSDDGRLKEKLLADRVSSYKTADGTYVLSDYTAYSNTVEELYDVEKAVEKLDLSEKDAEMLFTMYNLYRDPDSVTMSFSEFVEFSNELLDTDEDVAEFVDEDTEKTIRTLKVVSEILSGRFTAKELHEKLTTGVMAGTDIELFEINQLYGLYYYGDSQNVKADFKTMLDYIIASYDRSALDGALTESNVNDLRRLSAGIDEFESQMEMQMTKESFKGFMYQSSGVLLSDEELSQIFAGYYISIGQTPQETAPLLPLLKFMVASGLIADETQVATINGYDRLYSSINCDYSYEEFIPALTSVATALSGESPSISASSDEIQQIYIMYFFNNGSIHYSKMDGKEFVKFAIDSYKNNSAVGNRLGLENKNKLEDMLTADKYFADKTQMNYKTAYEKFSELQKELKSDTVREELDEAKISGVYIKCAILSGHSLTEPTEAYLLLDFVENNMDTNSLLIEKMDDNKREKVADAQKDVKKATDLFFGENYSRMLLSVNLPNESEETTKFVEYLSDEVKDVFGENAYVAGEIVSTYDLEKSFDHDNTFITVFTLVSIFVIVMVVFRSLSLPVILVAIIQGAIFVAMSTQLLSDGIFFMSYIVSTCILMGATIDYGILMSSTYVEDRLLYDKKEALERSVGAAMPTVFSSGLILTVCGFVIHFISSQNSISTVGLLLGIGTISSVVMITLVLPSTLYLLDGFVMKFSAKGKKKQ